MKIRVVVLPTLICCLVGAGTFYSLRNEIVVAGEGTGAVGKAMVVKAPLGLPPVPVPLGNPVTAERVALGRELFYDKRLSLDNTLSCSSCHNPFLGFTDGAMRSTGVGGKTGKRNAISVVNAAYDSSQFWDGRAATLESQVGTPMESPDEMAQPHAMAVAKLDKDAGLRERFRATFGAEPAAGASSPVSMDRVEKAIASFERTLISGNSAFDRYEFGGDKRALPAAAVRGLAVFKDQKKGNCVSCHTIGDRFALFTDGKFHNTGEGVDGKGDLTDLGRFVVTGREADKGAFKTPGLRNVAGSGPYMHDGKLRTLKEVVDFYAGGGNSNAYLDKEMNAISLTGRDRADLVEFLKSLTGEPPVNAGPAANAQAPRSAQ